MHESFMVHHMMKQLARTEGRTSLSFEPATQKWYVYTIRHHARPLGTGEDPSSACLDAIKNLAAIQLAQVH